MALSHFVIYSALFAAAFAEIATLVPCKDGPSSEVCTVTEVRINPCKLKDNVCTIKKGLNATISFDFTPNFVASKMKTKVVWPSPSGEMPFVGMPSDDACVMTTCPTVIGQSQTLVFTVYLGKKLPNGVFDTKWRVWNEEDEQQKCCFITTIQLKK